MSIKHMSKTHKPVHISEEEVLQSLFNMEQDEGLKTDPEYSSNPLYFDQLIPFAQKHAEYLKSHPKVNPEHYLANLRTMIKIRLTK
jgi:hypothetical protein